MLSRCHGHATALLEKLAVSVSLLFQRLPLLGQRGLFFKRRACGQLRLYRVQFGAELVVTLHQFGHRDRRHTARRWGCCGRLAFGCLLLNIGKLGVLHCANGFFALGVLGQHRGVLRAELCHFLLGLSVRLLFFGRGCLGRLHINDLLQRGHLTRSVLILGIELGQRLGRVFGGFRFRSGLGCKLLVFLLNGSPSACASRYANACTNRGSKHRHQRRGAVALHGLVVRQGLAYGSTINDFLQDLSWQLTYSKPTRAAQDGVERTSASDFASVGNKFFSGRSSGGISGFFGYFLATHLLEEARHGDFCADQIQRRTAGCVRGQLQRVDIRLFAGFFLRLDFFLGLPTQCLDEANNGRERVLPNLRTGDSANGAKYRTQSTATQTASSRKTCGLQHRRRNRGYGAWNLFECFARSRAVLALLERGGNLLGVKPRLKLLLEFFLAGNACLGCLCGIASQGRDTCAPEVHQVGTGTHDIGHQAFFGGGNGSRWGTERFRVFGVGRTHGRCVILALCDREQRVVGELDVLGHRVSLEF